MRPAAGLRDTWVVFRRRTETQGVKSGARKYDWADVEPGEWAEVQDMLPSKGESVSESIDMARRPCRIRCEWRPDVTADMRVRIDGRDRELEIVSGPVMLGRRDGLELVCAELSTEGEAP